LISKIEDSFKFSISSCGFKMNFPPVILP
jgi:hypothetical protein